MGFSRFPLLKPLVLIPGYAIAGFLLTAYAVPWFIWLGTLAVTLYLAWVGVEGMILAGLWLLGLFFAGAVNRCWFVFFPQPDFRILALALLLNWVFGASLCWSLAQTSQHLRSHTPFTWRSWLYLAFLTGLGFAIGVLIFTIYL